MVCAMLAALVRNSEMKYPFVTPVTQEIRRRKRQHELGVPGIPGLPDSQAQSKCLSPWGMLVPLHL